MSKLLSLLIATTFATASVGAFAMSHGPAPKEGAKMDCSKEKMEKMDDKMKAECKKMESKAEPKK
jgi:hypothetical protein